MRRPAGDVERRHAPTVAEERAVLASVIYASIFDYPLTRTQLREALIGVRADEDQLAAWYDASPMLQAAIEYRNGCYFPRGRGDLLQIRRTREALSRAMLRELRRPLALVRRMPFVRMVALTGSLAHLNADGEADLDLFVITAPGRVWSVTLTVLMLARLFGWRRRLCLNYVISERRLAVEPRDLFSANQIVHLRPISGQDVYRRFLAANEFVQRMYPSFGGRHIESPFRQPAPREKPPLFVVESTLEWTLAPLYEGACRAFYGWHLQRRAHRWQSRDQVRLEPECLKLHTSSHRADVMARFEQAMARAEAEYVAEIVSGVL